MTELNKQFHFFFRFYLLQVVPMTMTSNEKRMLEREALRSVIQQWNANRLDLFELSEPDEVRVCLFTFLQ